MEHPIFNKIENSKKPDFGDVLSKSFELYKKTFSMGVTHSLISLVIMIPFLLIVYVPVLPGYIEMIQNAGDPYYQPSFFEDISPVMIVIWVLVIFIMSFLLQVLNFSVYGHFLKALKKIDLNTDDDIGGYFTIAKQHFGKIILISLATMGIALLATLACYFPIFYVMVPFQLVIPIFIFNQEMSVGDIIKAAFKLGNKYWLVLFGLIFISGMLSALGVIACYVGIIFTMFFSYVVSYYVYKDTVGFEHGEPEGEQTLFVK
ncbi:hypothetical protein [Aquimarina aggregata]|uniref:hypothetical protein n=1 Tax=Aquimarina aggregata TaxID=1642818 RepID=UPI002493B3AC|nr:hypothetical protein [Aquimarina aggregata]